jgi:YbbR domain-containing protein
MVLLIAVAVWSVATSEENPRREGLYPEALSVEVVNLPEGLVVFQKSADTVRLKIRAPQVAWEQLNTSSFRVLLDLKSLDAGLYQVPVKLQIADPRVFVVAVEPSAIGIRLEQFKSRSFDVHSDVLDTAPPGFTAKSPTVNPAQVTVSGPGLLVAQVAEVVADVFLRGAKAPFEREVTLAARDAQGNVVSGVTLTPATVIVNVQIEQRVGYKDVSIKAVLKGVVAPGYWVSNIVVTPSTATIVGSAEILAKIPGFVETYPIDVSGATLNVTKRVGLSLPESVSVLNDEGTTVQVAVTPILGGQTVPRKVIVQGLRRDLSVAISPASVDVILSGPLPNLQNLSPDDVQVVIDVSGLSAGAYQLKPRVPVVPNALKVQSVVPDTVQVMLTEPTPGIAPTATISATVTSSRTTPAASTSATPTVTPR